MVKQIKQVFEDVKQKFFASPTANALTISSKVEIPCSLLLSYLFKGGDPLLSPSWLSSRKQQHYALFSLVIFSKMATLCSLFLDYLLEGSNPTLSSLAIFSKATIPNSLLPLVFLPSENPFFLSWFHALFSLSPQGGFFGQSYQILCKFVYL